MADNCMRRHDIFEIKAATFLIGLVQIGVSFTAQGSGDSLFVKVLDASHLAPWWGAVMFSVGVWTLTASMLPNRASRHHALVASWAVLWSTFGAFVFWGRMTLPVALIWTHGTAALVVFLVDVHAYNKAKNQDARRYGTAHP